MLSPFEKHLFFNVCTLGYTAPFWDWERWEKEIDWLALHGFDMPLNPIAFEAISARVYRQLGLSEEADRCNGNVQDEQNSSSSDRCCRLAHAD